MLDESALPRARVPIPCHKDCPQRSSDCHAGCERYAKYVAYRRFIYGKRLQDWDVNEMEYNRMVRRGKYYNND